jgi:hypothetical protein
MTSYLSSSFTDVLSFFSLIFHTIFTQLLMQICWLLFLTWVKVEASGLDIWPLGWLGEGFGVWLGEECR